ncbi:MAG TPA: glutamate formimidoyltransferase [Pyrinomonadaceae bacterium]|nr:glutamate formimidoyltransferase [Pyrinomonadaceae bacterium]
MGIGDDSWERVVECVPNFSAGRSAEVVARLAEAVESAGEAVVLDEHVDPDHNRSVITFVATPEAAVEAAVRAVALASELIDLREHAGQHPRIGATDVLPFVPVRGVTMEECARLAHAAGRRIWDELRIPVYFYESAALRPDRVNLEDVRRKGFEQLRDEIARDPARAPDVGEARLHESAGATAVGARRLLVAYNINLRTEDVGVARRIARAARGRDGGLRYLKALGFALPERGLTQVSMNLVNFERTQLHHVFEFVRREAERWGVEVAGSEIVGLVPQAALDRAAEYYLRAENFTPDAVLENRITAALRRRGRVETETEELADLDAAAGDGSRASAPPAPESALASGVSSGGEAAAGAASLAAALGEMVARLIAGQKRFRGDEEEVRDAVQELALLRARLSDAARADAASFKRVVAARHLPHGAPEEERMRANAVEAALKGATNVPLEVAGAAVQIGELLETLAELGDPRWLSDSATGAQLVLAATTAARYNVLVNTADIEDDEFAAEHRSRADDLLERARASAARVEQLLTDSLS